MKQEQGTPSKRPLTSSRRPGGEGKSLTSSPRHGEGNLPPVSILHKDGEGAAWKGSNKRVNFQAGIKPPPPQAGRATPSGNTSKAHVAYAKGASTSGVAADPGHSKGKENAKPLVVKPPLRPPAKSAGKRVPSPKKSSAPQQKDRKNSAERRSRGGSAERRSRGGSASSSTASLPRMSGSKNRSGSACSSVSTLSLREANRGRTDGMLYADKKTLRFMYSSVVSAALERFGRGLADRGATSEVEFADDELVIHKLPLLYSDMMFTRHLVDKRKRKPPMAPRMRGDAPGGKDTKAKVGGRTWSRVEAFVESSSAQSTARGRGEDLPPVFMTRVSSLISLTPNSKTINATGK